jgi:ornithine cyclodeaminase
MRVIPAADIDRALSFPALVDALAEGFRAGIVTPVRHHHEIAREGPHGTLLLMPAWSPEGAIPSYVGTKVVTVFPGNAARSLPSVLGTYLLLHGETGEPLCALDGTRLTLWRTAAASALAASFLARADATRMVMVGAGALAPFLVDAHRALKPIRHVGVWNRNVERAEQLARDLAGEGFGTVEVVSDLEQAVRQADIVSCATLSTAPVVRGEWLKPGAHLDLVGAFNLHMREADDAALLRARLFVDTPAALSEGGDVALGLKAGVIAPARVEGDLFSLCRGEATGRAGADEITLFKSVGTALEDLVAAMLVWKRLRGAA